MRGGTRLGAGFETEFAPAVASFEGTDWIAWKDISTGSIWWSMVEYRDDGGVVVFDVRENLAGAATSAGPALTAFKGRLYMAWKGEGQDERIFISSGPELYAPGSGVLEWSPQRLGPAAAMTGGSPALGATDSTLFLLWKEAGSGWHIWLSTSTDGVTWSVPERLPPAGGTSDTPALASIGDVLYVAWKAEPGDRRIFWSKCVAGVWEEQRQVEGLGGTSAGPGLCVDPEGNLRLVWKGEIGDTRLFSSFLTSPLSNLDWTPQQLILDAASSARPALASPSGGMAWRGVGDDFGIYVGQSDSVTPPIPRRPTNLTPANANFTEPATLRWTDPAAGTVGRAQEFEFYVGVNDVIYPPNATGPTVGVDPYSNPIDIPAGQIQWGVRGVNNSGPGPWASVSFANDPGPVIVVTRVGSTNDFVVTGKGFTPNGPVHVEVRTAIAGGTQPIETSAPADGNGDLNPSVSLNCGPTCASAGGGKLLFQLTDETSGHVSNVVTEDSASDSDRRVTRRIDTHPAQAPTEDHS